jgi:5'-deoxynucleotidase YfbR-like HD superfamily hydrolase
MSLVLADQLRASHVKRWHIVQTARQQTLAEHSFNVAAIAGELAVKMQWVGLMHVSRKLHLLDWALQHDLIEVKTGDMPTPFKDAIRAVGGEKMLEALEDRVDPQQMYHYRQYKGTEEEMIVKLADTIEAVYFLQDNGIGYHARQVLNGLRVNLREMTEAYAEKFKSIRVRDGVRDVCLGIEIWDGIR